MDATVFYAWQSDRPRKTTRDLIRNAAEGACKRITEDYRILEPALDSDTEELRVCATSPTRYWRR